MSFGVGSAVDLVLTITAKDAATEVLKGIASALEGVVTKTADFQTSLTQIQNNTTLTTANIDTMKRSILAMGSESGANLDDLGQAFMRATNLGFDMADAIKVVHAGMESAVSTGSQTADVVNTLALQMHEFGISADQAGEAMNVLHLAAALGNATLEQFVTSTSKATSMAANLGIPITQVDAALAALSRHMDLSQASTALAGAFSKLVNPAAQTVTELTHLSQVTGIDLVGDFTAAGMAAKGFPAVMDDLKRATGGNVTEQLKLIPAMRGGLAEMVLLGTGSKDFTDILNQLNATMGGKTDPTTQAYQRTLGTFNNQVNRLRNDFQQFAMLVGQPILTVLQPEMEKFITYLDDHKADVTAFGTAIGTDIGGAIRDLAANMPGWVGTLKTEWHDFMDLFDPDKASATYAGWGVGFVEMMNTAMLEAGNELQKGLNNFTNMLSESGPKMLAAMLGGLDELTLTMGNQITKGLNKVLPSFMQSPVLTPAQIKDMAASMNAGPTALLGRGSPVINPNSGVLTEAQIKAQLDAARPALQSFFNGIFTVSPPGGSGAYTPYPNVGSKGVLSLPQLPASDAGGSAGGTGSNAGNKGGTGTGAATPGYLDAQQQASRDAAALAAAQTALSDAQNRLSIDQMKNAPQATLQGDIKAIMADFSVAILKHTPTDIELENLQLQRQIAKDTSGALAQAQSQFSWDLGHNASAATLQADIKTILADMKSQGATQLDMNTEQWNDNKAIAAHFKTIMGPHLEAVKSAIDLSTGEGSARERGLVTVRGQRGPADKQGDVSLADAAAFALDQANKRLTYDLDPTHRATQGALTADAARIIAAEAAAATARSPFTGLDRAVEQDRLRALIAPAGGKDPVPDLIKGFGNAITEGNKALAARDLGGILGAMGREPGQYTRNDITAQRLAGEAAIKALFGADVDTAKATFGSALATGGTSVPVLMADIKAILSAMQASGASPLARQQTDIADTRQILSTLQQQFELDRANGSDQTTLLADIAQIGKLRLADGKTFGAATMQAAKDMTQITQTTHATVQAALHAANPLGGYSLPQQAGYGQAIISLSMVNANSTQEMLRRLSEQNLALTQQVGSLQAQIAEDRKQTSLLQQALAAQQATAQHTAAGSHATQAVATHLTKAPPSLNQTLRYGGTMIAPR